MDPLPQVAGHKNTLFVPSASQLESFLVPVHSTRRSSKQESNYSAGHSLRQDSRHSPKQDLTHSPGHSSKQAAAPCIVKLCLPQELAFYSQVLPTLPGVQAQFFINWAAEFWGTLSEVPFSSSSALPALPTSTATASTQLHCIVLQNLNASFRTPCALDVKLGQTRHDSRTLPSKLAGKKLRAAREGCDVTGMAMTGISVVPSSSSSSSSSRARRSSPVPMKRDLVKAFNPANYIGALRVYFAHLAPHPALLLHLLRLLIETLGALRQDLRRIHWETMGVSVFIMYEGDVGRLRALINALPDGEFEFRNGERHSSVSAVGESAEHDPRVGDGDGDDESEEEDEDDKAQPLPFDVKLIDFSHVEMDPANQKGPDKGMILGLDTLLGVFEEFKSEVERQSLDQSVPFNAP